MRDRGQTPYVLVRARKITTSYVLYLLEYYCTDTLVPRYTDIFKTNRMGADILTIYHTVQIYSISFGGIPHVGQVL